MAGLPFFTRAELTADLRALGLRRGDAVLVHAALSKVGAVIDGPDTLVGALLDAVSPGGTVLAHAGWDAPYEELLDVDGRVPRRWRKHVPPFDAGSSRADRNHGLLPEYLRTRPGARRSGSPLASVAAVGARAEWFTADHPLHHGFGAGSPYARLVEAGGKVAMVGAPFETMTLLHHAENLADLDGRESIYQEIPFATPDGTVWRTLEYVETGPPVTGQSESNTYGSLVSAFVNTGGGRTGWVGNAVSLVVDAPEMCAFAVRWLQEQDDED